MKAPFGWAGPPRGSDGPPKGVTLKRIISDGDKEAETLCRGCSYNTTDLERKFYGRYLWDEGKIIRQHHFCTFCAEDTAYRHRIFKDLDFKIHEAKVRLREKSLKSSGYLYIAALRQTLEEQHYEEIHNAPYAVDAGGTRAYNGYEIEFMDLTKSIREYHAAPRHLYLEALEEFGGVSDEAPCTRNLTKRQKRKLLRKMKMLL